jgi:Zn-dependent peptidase ImmA (M78 family)/DNA-binding XRE family transcriptional regulator
MLSQQIRQLRLARGLSLEALAQRMSGIVTKQALSKYEQDKATPSPLVLSKLATALGVKVVDLVRSADVQIEFIAYRRKASLGKRQQEQVQSLVHEAILQRLQLQQLSGQLPEHQIPVQRFPVETLADTERAAEDLRQLWEVGTAPIANMTMLLEDNAVHVIDLDADDAFDGIAAIARDSTEQILAASVVTRRGLPGERQRLNLAHELGHLVMQLADGVDAEKAAFRFAGALLAPADSLRAHVGERRGLIQAEELLLLKQAFGMSVQALLYRLRTLGIITESYYQSWCIDISRLGWRRREPGELPAEVPTWQRRTVLRALSEELLSAEAAARMLGEGQPANAPLVYSRRAFAQLPLDERRRMLAEQAAQMYGAYADDPERDLWQGDDIVEQ